MFTNEKPTSLHFSSCAHIVMCIVHGGNYIQTYTKFIHYFWRKYIYLKNNISFIKYKFWKFKLSIAKKIYSTALKILRHVFNSFLNQIIYKKNPIFRISIVQSDENRMKLFEYISMWIVSLNPLFMCIAWWQIEFGSAYCGQPWQVLEKQNKKKFKMDVHDTHEQYLLLAK